MEKNAKKFTKLYNEKSQENFDTWGYYYPPRNWDEFIAWDNGVFNKYLKNKKEPRLYLKILDTTKDFGYLHAFEKSDYKLLNNVIFQTSRHELLNSAMTAGGTDHCNLLFDVLSAFASNDFDIIECFFPKNLPQSKGIYCTGVSVNLLKVLYYNQNEFADFAILKANEFLKKKITALEEYVVKFFIALFERDLENINISLQELCKAYQRQGYPVDKLNKCFAIEIHGLYRFIKIIDESFFEKVEKPKHDCFFQDFELWQKDNNYPKGKLFYEYPGEMNYMNRIFKAKIPKVTLFEYKNSNTTELLEDVDVFAEQLTENIKS